MRLAVPDDVRGFTALLVNTAAGGAADEVDRVAPALELTVDGDGSSGDGSGSGKPVVLTDLSAIGRALARGAKGPPGAAARLLGEASSGGASASASTSAAAEVLQWLTFASAELLAGPAVTDAALAALNEALLSRTYLAGNALTVADLVVFGAVHPAVMRLPVAQADQLCALLRWYDLVQHTADPDRIFTRVAVGPKPAFVPPPPPAPPAPATAGAAAGAAAGSKGKKDKDGGAAAASAASTSTAAANNNAQGGGGKKKGGGGAAAAAAKPDAAAAATSSSSSSTTTAAAAGGAAAAAPADDKADKKGAKADKKAARKEARAAKAAECGGGGGKDGAAAGTAAAAAAGAGAGAAAAGAAAAADEPTIDLIDIRVGRIVSCERHPNAEALYLEQIDVGEASGPRQVISGLVKFVPLERMVGRTVLVCCNLKPAKMRDVMSYGMVLCASDAEHTAVDPVAVPAGVPLGERVTFEGFGKAPLEEVNPKKKILERLFPDLKTDASGAPTYKGVPFMTSLGPCSSSIPNGSVA